MISHIILRLNQSSQAISIFLGSIIISLFSYVLITNNSAFIVFDWLVSTLGYSFIAITTFLTITSLLCIINVINYEQFQKKFWFETGLQLSNLISTVALTYTLLGISLGIGELSSSKLDIDTINQTISNLTEQFSMAFITSVIGLPLSGLLRSILIIFYEHSKVPSSNSNLNIIKSIGVK